MKRGFKGKEGRYKFCREGKEGRIAENRGGKRGDKGGKRGDIARRRGERRAILGEVLQHDMDQPFGESDSSPIHFIHKSYPIVLSFCGSARISLPPSIQKSCASAADGLNASPPATLAVNDSDLTVAYKRPQAGKGRSHNARHQLSNYAIKSSPRLESNSQS